MSWNKIKELVEARADHDSDVRAVLEAPKFSCGFRETRDMVPDDNPFKRQVRILLQIHLGQTVWLDQELVMDGQLNKVAESHIKRFEHAISHQFYGDIVCLLQDLASHIDQRNWEEARGLIADILMDA